MIRAMELYCGCYYLFEALRFCRSLPKFVKDLVHHFGALIDKIWLYLLIQGSASTNNKALFINSQVFIYIRWKFHF